MEKMREEFEAWKANDTGAPVSVIVSKRELDGYSYDRLNREWVTWQAGWEASRAAQCVELPRCWNDKQRDYRDELVERFDAAGIRYT